MPHIASCGHTLTPEEDLGIQVSWLEYDDELNQSLISATYCKACHDRAQKEGWLLTQEQVNKWYKKKTVETEARRHYFNFNA